MLQKINMCQDSRYETRASVALSPDRHGEKQTALGWRVSGAAILRMRSDLI